MKAQLHSRSREVWLDWLILLSLLGIALYLRYRALQPSSLFFDDAWQAIVYRTRNLTEAALVRADAPGFSFGLRAWLRTVGFSSLNAQFFPLLLGVLIPPVVYLVARRRGWTIGASLLAGALIATSPVHAEYSTRVKQFTLDAVLALGIIALAWSTLNLGPSRLRWALLLGGGILATVMSGLAAPVVAGEFAVVIGVSAVQRRPGWGWGIAASLAYGVFAAAWWTFVLAEAINRPLVDYWNPFYIEARTALGFVEGLTVAVLGVLRGLTFVPLWLVAPALVAIAIVALRKGHNEVLVFVSPVVVAVVLATLHLAPLGTGRTDVYLYPGLALLAGAGLELAWKRNTRLVRWASLLGIAMLLLFAPRAPDYPAEDVRPLVAIADTHGIDEPVIVYPWAWWAYSLYTSGPVAFYKTDFNPEGFAIRLEDDQVRYFDFNLGEPELKRLTHGAEVAWFVASHLRSDWPDDFAMIDSAFNSLGYVIGQRWELPGAVLIRWERRS